MIRIFLALIPLSLLLIAGKAEGQDCDRQDYDSTKAPDFNCPGPEEESLVPPLSPPKAVPVHQGEGVVADWDGALVHRDRLILLGLKLSAVRRLRWADRLRVTKRCDIELEYLREQNEIREELFEQQNEAQRERALAAERRVRSAEAWYRSWWFGAILGFTGAAALVALAAYVFTVI